MQTISAIYRSKKSKKTIQSITITEELLFCDFSSDVAKKIEEELQSSGRSRIELNEYIEIEYIR